MQGCLMTYFAKRFFHVEVNWFIDTMSYFQMFCSSYFDRPLIWHTCFPIVGTVSSCCGGQGVKTYCRAISRGGQGNRLYYVKAWPDEADETEFKSE